MALKGAEGVMDELKTALSTYLPARIAAVAAEAPVLTMPNPVEYLIGQRDTIPTYPVVILEDRPSPVLMDRGQRIRFRHRIDVGIVVTEPNEETIRRLIRRYARAIAETLMDRRGHGAGASDSDFSFDLLFSEEDWDFSPTYADETGLFLADAWIPLACERTEQR